MIKLILNILFPLYTKWEILKVHSYIKETMIYFQLVEVRENVLSGKKIFKSTSIFEYQCKEDDNEREMLTKIKDELLELEKNRFRKK